MTPTVTRRGALGAAILPLVAACSPPLLPLTGQDPSPAADALLARAAAAHGLPALAALRDVSVRTEGTWPALIGRLQPALVDERFRGGSEERVLLRDRIVAQAHTGPAGRKQVVRAGDIARQGTVRVWFNGEETRDAERRAAAALVADGYALFLLGPMLLARERAAGRVMTLAVGEPERIVVADRPQECDVLQIAITPGLGFSPGERLALFIDRADGLMRRVRFGLEGLDSTRGAVAEVDAWDHVTLGGVRWPTRFHERLLRPLPLAVHDWRLTGLDVDRGMEPGEVGGVAFTGRALEPARAV